VSQTIELTGNKEEEAEVGNLKAENNSKKGYAKRNLMGRSPGGGQNKVSYRTGRGARKEKKKEKSGKSDLPGQMQKKSNRLQGVRWQGAKVVDQTRMAIGCSHGIKKVSKGGRKKGGMTRVRADKHFKGPR